MDYLKGFLGSKAIISSRTWGPLTVEAVSFSPAIDGDLLVQVGEPWEHPNPLVRIHSECIFGEAFDSALCDCADQLKLAMARITLEGCGMLFYLRLDGRGAGLAAKVKATAYEVDGMDTHESRIHVGVPPESRNFESIGNFLVARGISQVRLLTNNPDKVKGLEQAGIRVSRESLLVKEPSDEVRKLYETKAEKFGHTIPQSHQNRS